MSGRKNRRNPKFHSTSSCRYLLQCYLIFVCKYRKKLLQGPLNDDMKQYLFEVSQKYDFEIKVMESDIDHIHFLIDYMPKISISQIVRVLKQETTIKIWKNTELFSKDIFGKSILFGLTDILLRL